MLTIRGDFSEAKALFADLGVKLPKVMADTVNVLGGMVKESTINEMRSKFKGGTSGWVLNSFGISRATASNPTSTVSYNRGRNFMKTQVDGGTRPTTGAERLLQRKSVMPNSSRMLPGPGAAKDQYGNLNPGTRSQVLSFFKVYSGKQARNNRQGATLRSGVSFFSIFHKVCKLPLGIYQRVDDPAVNALRAQRAMIAKQLIKAQGKGFGYARGSRAGKDLRSRLGKELSALNKAMVPRGIKMVVAFDDIKAYTPLIKFYDIGRKIVSNNAVSVFRRVAAVELGNRLVKR